MGDENTRELPATWRSGDWQSLSDAGVGGAARQLRVSADSLPEGAVAGKQIAKLVLRDQDGAIVGFVPIYES
jgi:hypothetical protein